MKGGSESKNGGTRGTGKGIHIYEYLKTVKPRAPVCRPERI